jgi:CheY-like chemotaxis protein
VRTAPEVGSNFFPGIQYRRLGQLVRRTELGLLIEVVLSFRTEVVHASPLNKELSMMRIEDVIYVIRFPATMVLLQPLVNVWYQTIRGFLSDSGQNPEIMATIPTPPPSSKALTILCVDDLADGLAIRKTLLEKAGYIVVSALSGEQALKIFKSQRVDVVVSDHLLGDVTGTEVARLMKLARPEVPIVLLSGVIEPPPGTEHTDKFVDKTEGPEKLLEAIAAVTRKSRPAESNGPVLVKPVLPKKSQSAAAMDRNKGAATVAHEINNPLDSLLNLLYLADAEPSLTDTAHRYLALARAEVGRISQIAHAALHEPTGDEGPENTNVPQLLRSVTDFYKSRLQSRGISVDTRCCPDGDIPVFAGPLRQVFTNLVLNAAESMAQGGKLQARVAIAHEWSGQQRHGLRVTFADNGCGIPSDSLHEIFEPFFTTKPRGSGLGLSLVKEVVQKHSGSLRVRSSTRPGHTGTVLTVFLPSDLHPTLASGQIGPRRA